MAWPPRLISVEARPAASAYAIHFSLTAVVNDIAVTPHLRIAKICFPETNEDYRFNNAD
jgi:hypothetical protein